MNKLSYLGVHGIYEFGKKNSLAANKHLALPFYKWEQLLGAIIISSDFDPNINSVSISLYCSDYIID